MSVSERSFQDRDIVYFLQQPETNSFFLYHDYTESRLGMGNVGEKFLYNWTDDYNYEIIKHTLAAEPEQIKLMHEMVRYVMDTSLKAVKREDIFKALDFDPRSTQGQMCKRALRLAVDKGYLWKVVGKPGHYSLPPATVGSSTEAEGETE